MAIVNNVTRMLDAKGIAYTAHELPGDRLGAVAAAKYLGVKPDMVYKTIVVKRTDAGKPILALVPGTAAVDLKALARALGEKKVKLASHREAEDMTGLETGGISPLALLQRGFEVMLDGSAEERKTIFVSGGERGLNVEIAPGDLVALTDARLAAIASPGK